MGGGSASKGKISAIIKPRLNKFLAIVIGVLIFLFSLMLRFLLREYLPVGFPYLTFFPAVILTSFFYGTVSGAVCAVLGGAASWWWFISPGVPFSLEGGDLLALGFYGFIVSVDIALIHFMRVATKKLALAQNKVTTLYKQQNTMFQELQHRAANNLQFISGILHFGKSKVVESPEAWKVMDEAQSRLQSFSAIHRRLYDPSKANLPAHYQLSELCDDLMAANGNNSIKCIVEDTSAVLDLTRLTIVSMLVSEIITNSIKHAFQCSHEGIISVKLENKKDQFILTVSDNGIGFQGDNMPVEKRSLGLKIISSFAAQLGCQPKYTSNNGTTIEFVFSSNSSY